MSEDDFSKFFEFKSKFGVLKRIPKGARPQSAQSFVKLVRSCIASNDLTSWYNLFTFVFQAFHIPSRKVFLKIDYKNAFNSSERDRMLSSVMKKTLLLYKYFWQCYGEPTLLIYNSDIIESAVGAQQGDPAGGLLFSLSLQPVIDDVESDLNLLYLDDGSLCDEPEIVLEDFARLIQSSKELGLEVNPAKCELS